MPKLENRIIADDPQLHFTNVLWSLKELQEKNQFTDVNLFCRNGESLSVHKALLGKLSPFLGGLLEDSSCCFCQGSKCGGGSSHFGITLEAVSIESLSVFLEMMYTGRTYFETKDNAKEIASIMRMLQIRLPSSAFTMETLDGTSASECLSDFQRSLKRKGDTETWNEKDSLSSENPLELSQNVKMRKMSDGGALTTTDDEISLIDESHINKTCVKCGKNFHNQFVYIRHLNSCHSVENGNSSIFPPNDKSLLRRIPCPKCGVPYPDSGWFKRHVKICTKSISSLNSVIRPVYSLGDSSPSDPSDLEGKKDCPKCNRYFFIKQGGYVRHVRVCTGISPLPSASASSSLNCSSSSSLNGSSDEPIKGKKCHKCGKVYTPKNYRYFEPHVSRCTGILDSSSVSNSSSSASNCHNSNNSNNSESPSNLIGTLQTCSGCKKSFTLNHWYQKHLSTCRKRENNSGLGSNGSNGVSVSGLDSMFRCHKCSLPYHSSLDLKKHYIQHYGSAVRDAYFPEFNSDICPLCPFVGQTRHHILNHLCLKHEKLKEFLPADVAKSLFGDPLISTSSSDSNPRPSISPSSSLPVPSGSSDSENFLSNCHVCGKVFSNRTTLRSHIFTHYLGDLRKVYHDPHDSAACTLCPYRSNSIHHLMIHVGLKHKKLAEFLPREIATYFFDETGPLLGASMGPPPPPPLKQMRPKVVAPHSYSRSAPTKNWICMFCYKEMGNDKGNLKQHLLCHTRDKIRDNFMSSSNPKSCLFCDYKCNLPDHMVTHVGLTHQKIREFLPRDYGDILFRGPYAFELSPNVSNICEHCSEEFSSEDDLETHYKESGGSCSWTCSKCGLRTQGRKNIEKHAMYCQRKASSFNCEICGVIVCDLNSFKSHLCSHFRAELLTSIGDDIIRCDDCGIDFTEDQNGLADHVGSVHDLIFNVLPLQLLKKVKALMMETIFCFVCQREFNSSEELAAHECNIADEEDLEETTVEDDENNDDNDDGRAEEEEEEMCKLCSSTLIVSYSQYKEHLLGHFLDKLNKDIRPSYNAENPICERCNGAFESPDEYVKHMALDHDEVFTYLSQDVMTHVKSFLHKASSGANYHDEEDDDEMYGVESTGAHYMDFVIKEESLSETDFDYGQLEDVEQDYSNVSYNDDPEPSSINDYDNDNVEVEIQDENMMDISDNNASINKEDRSEEEEPSEETVPETEGNEKSKDSL